MKGRAILQQLDMWSSTGPEPGLVSVEGWIDNESLTTDEAVAAERAEEMGAHYVYLRHFEQRPPIPQAYVYDFSSDLTASRKTWIATLGCDLQELQRRLWNASYVPLAFVFLPSEVIVLNCFQEPAPKSVKPLAAVKLAAKAAQDLSGLKAFSARSLDDGTFWDLSPHGAKVHASKSAYECLIRELGDVLRKIRRRQLLPDDIARKLLLIFVLLKYLEERRDSEGRGVFPPGFFAGFVNGAKELTDVMASGAGLLRLLDTLAAPNKLNGDVFRLTDRERTAIETANFQPIADFLRGDSEGQQLHLWRRYDFRYLPVELVSSIYEEFVTKADTTQRRAKGAVYTPAYLVSFLLDLTLPIGEGSHKIRVLDPACGSGVFLVGVFRRLVLRWRRVHGWQRPSLQTLKDILGTSIYGVDSDPDAVNVTIFSLALALCDHLEPREIWEELHFDRLRDCNIIHADFFSVIRDRRWATEEKRFDLIVGNPPFKEELTEEAALIEKEEVAARAPVPQGQLALLFLEQAVKLTQPNATTCLLQPAGPLLYNPTAAEFRSYLLNTWHIPQIIDFTHTCRVVFGPGGDVAFAAAFIENRKPTDAPLLHLTVRRTRAAKEKLFFEVDHYDFHYLKRREAEENAYVWKANLLGGGRVIRLLQRLGKCANLGDFLASPERAAWKANEGFVVAGGGKTADFLTGHDYLPTEGFTENGVDEASITVLSVQSFHSTGDPAIYREPHLLVKERIGSNSRIPVALFDTYLVFRNEIMGIHAPPRHGETLVRLAELVGGRLSAFSALALSPRLAVNKSSSLRKADLLLIPVSDDLTQPDMTPLEDILIDDVMGPILEFRREGEDSAAAKPPTDEHLREFGRLFVQILGTTYRGLNAGEPLSTDRHVFYPFWFGSDAPDIDLDGETDLDLQLDALLAHEHSPAFRIVRILKCYQGNAVLLVKPRQLRYWLRSAAIRDADETFEDLIQQGY